MSKEAVEAFYQRLSSDQEFYQALENSQSKTNCQAIVKAAGYDFTEAELNNYTAQLLEPTETGVEIHPPNSPNFSLNYLNKKELEAVVGGAIALTSRNRIFLPPYGLPPDLHQ